MSKSGSDSENFDEEQAVQSCSIQPHQFEPRKNSDEADSNSEGDESMASDEGTSSNPRLQNSDWYVLSLLRNLYRL